MFFAPQQRALFRRVNFQKWSDVGVRCAFWLGNALRATTACNFSSLIWPAGSAPAALARLLFDPPGPQIIGKPKWIATFLPFRAPASSFFSLFLFSDLLTSFLLLSDSSHLCFSICPYWSLTSKLPLIRYKYIVHMYIYIYIHTIYIYTIYIYILYIYILYIHYIYTIYTIYILYIYYTYRLYTILYVYILIRIDYIYKTNILYMCILYTYYKYTIYICILYI